MSIPLSPAEGVLEIVRDYGFLRKPENAYQPNSEDVYVPRQLIEGYELRQGCLVSGRARPQRRGGKPPQLEEVERLEGVPPEEYRRRPHFHEFTSIDPRERLRIDESGDPSMRVLDLVAPIGKGQRGLIVAPPRTGKTMLLQKLAHSIAQAHPEVRLMVVLIAERPEEVTEMKRTVQGEVLASSADQTAKDHVRLADLVLQRARRLVEGGEDVVILLDSITRMARAYNVQHKGSGRTLSGGLSVGSMTKPREFFGAARCTEEGGSLTIIATALIDTGSRMDDVIFEEFKGTGNMELVLSRSLADRRVFPAIDIHASGTRKEEKLRDPEAQRKVNLMRRALSDLGPDRAMEALLKKVEETSSNQQFLQLLKV